MRVLTKTVTYRIVATVNLVLVSGLLTGDWSIAAKLGVVSVFMNSLVYATYDKLFDSIWARKAVA